MISSRSTGATPTEEMTSPSAERVVSQEETAASSVGHAATASGVTPACSDPRPAEAGVRNPWRGPDDGRGKVGRPGDGDRSDQRGTASLGAFKA